MSSLDWRIKEELGVGHIRVLESCWMFISQYYDAVAWKLSFQCLIRVGDEFSPRVCIFTRINLTRQLWKQIESMESMLARLGAVHGTQRLFWGCCVLLPLFINSRRLWNCRTKKKWDWKQSMFSRFGEVHGVQRLLQGCCFRLPLNSSRLWICRGKEGAVLGGFNANDLFQRLETIPD